MVKPNIAEPTLNQRHAEAALDAVYNHTDYNLEPPETLPTYIGDMLTNLMHLCNREKIDFNLCLQNAQMHYNEEKN